MTARRGSRPGNQHRFAKTRPAELCDARLDEWVARQLAARLAPATGKRRAATVDNFAREAGVSPVTATVCRRGALARQPWRPVPDDVCVAFRVLKQLVYVAPADWSFDSIIRC
jgi:hypothetical protein